MPLKRIAILLCLVATASAARAGPYADDLSKCLVQSTTTADKNLLVKWLFATAGLHPEVQSIVSISASDRDAVNKSMAALFERLLTVTCREEAKRALQYEGPSTMESSFQVLGQAAGRALFSSPEVTAGMAGTLKYIDRQKMSELAPAAK